MKTKVKNLVDDIEIFQKLSNQELEKQADIIQRYQTGIQKHQDDIKNYQASLSKLLEMANLTISIPSSQQTHSHPQVNNPQISNLSSQQPFPIPTFPTILIKSVDKPGVFTYAPKAPQPMLFPTPSKRKIYEFHNQVADSLIRSVHIEMFLDRPIGMSITLKFDDKDKNQIASLVSKNKLQLSLGKNSLSTDSKAEILKLLEMLTTEHKIRIPTTILNDINEFISPYVLKTNNSCPKTDPEYYTTLIKPNSISEQL